MKTTRALALFLAFSFLALVFHALATPTARAAPIILRVKVNGATSGTCGGSWAAACGLQHALKDIAIPGDELWVASGTYTPTTALTRTVSFQLRDGIALYGGFAGGGAEPDKRDVAANETILSGDIGTPGNVGDNSYHVVYAVGITSSAKLDGFTVTGGRANGNWPHNVGGGMYNDYSSPTLSNVTFSGNSASYYGGGMYNRVSSPTLTNVTFSGNSATYYGGGMYNYDYSSPTLSNVTFSGNSADYGGGMYNQSNSSPTLANVTFSGNSAGYGGGMHNYDYSSPTLANVTFSGNSAGYGGGMYNGVSSPALTNVTFSGNSASYYGGVMCNYSDSGPTIRNTIVWGNTAPTGSQIDNLSSTTGLYDSVVQGGCPAGSSPCDNIVTADPRLGTLGDWGGSTHTLPLLPGSSAIDAGNNATCAHTDQRGVARVGPCDIGAFEARPFTLTKNAGDGQTLIVNTPFPIALAVSVTGTGGDPVEGGVVAFTAPSSGASASPTTSTPTIAAGGTASPSLTANGSVGPYVVTADTAGATAPAIFALANAKANTTTSLTSSANPSAWGQDVTFTAVVSGVSPGGSVTFKDGAATLCDAVGLSGGSVECSLPSPALGAHAVTAEYGGDATNNPSTGALTQVVSKANTTAVITSSENPVLASHPVTFTVTVSAVAPGSGTPTGSVSFYETTAPSLAVRGTRRALASQPLVDGVATFTVPSLTPGAHALLALYDGDANYQASTSTLYTQNAYLLYYYFPWLGK